MFLFFLNLVSLFFFFFFQAEDGIRDGTVTGVQTCALPISGQMHVAGMTTSELEKAIKERSSDRLREPEISVMVAQLADRKVYVSGEVRVPGFVAYHEGLSPLQ